MENGVEKKEVVAEEKQGFVGGEIHIISDPKTGNIQVQAPENAVIALGLIEVAKEIVLEENRQRMRRAQAMRPPAIMKAGPEALKNLPPKPS